MMTFLRAMFMLLIVIPGFALCSMFLFGHNWWMAFVVVIALGVWQGVENIKQQRRRVEAAEAWAQEARTKWGLE